MRTLNQLAKEALQVQNACNLSAVLNGAVRAHHDLRQLAEADGKSWEWVDRHPVMQAWADKIASMTGTQTLGAEPAMAAFRECTALAK